MRGGNPYLENIAKGIMTDVYMDRSTNYCVIIGEGITEDLRKELIDDYSNYIVHEGCHTMQELNNLCDFGMRHIVNYDMVSEAIETYRSIDSYYKKMRPMVRAVLDSLEADIELKRALAKESGSKSRK